MKKKKVKHDYASLFFKKTETKARNGKTVYICNEHHDRIFVKNQSSGFLRLS